jgi:hypothetical protein
MKCLLFVLLSLVPRVSSAQIGPQSGGVIGIYADQTGYCLLLDTPGVKTLYVLHKFTTGSISSKFRLEFSPGFTGTLLNASPSVGTMSGDPIGGLTAAYGSCLSGTVEIMQVQLMMYGNSPECGWVRVMPLASSIDGLVDTYNCISDRAPATWQGTHIQHSMPPFCPDLNTGENHNPPSCNPYSPTVAVEPETWGAVKALYR